MTDIHARLGELSPAQRKILAARLKEKVAAAGAAPADGPREYPASFAQRRLWLLDRLQPGSHAYNMPGGWRFRGALDVQALERAMDELVRRHEALRTRLETRGAEPVQVVLPPAPLSLPRVDLSDRPRDEAEAELDRLVREDAERPFRLDEGPLFRASLVRLAADEYAVLWTVHHAVSDGWSADLMARELSVLYAAFSAGRPSPLPAPALQYGECALRERERLSGQGLERLVGFWRGALAGAPARLELPTDFPRPALRTPRGGVAGAMLGTELSAGVEALARAEGATPFMVYLAAFQLLLGRYARQKDVLVGTATANRATPDVEGTVGFFANTLVLRGRLDGEPTFRALVARTRDATLAAYDHQELPFEKLVEEVNPERSLSYAPLVQALFVLHNQGAPAPRSDAAPSPTAGGSAGGEDPALRVQPLGHEAVSARFDLSLSVAEGPHGAVAGLTYAADLWEQATAARMLARYAALLAAALADPDAPAWELPMFVAGERERATGEWAGDPRPFPRGAPFPARFADQARRTPDAAAVESPEGTYTYAELDAATARLARWLAARGAGSETRVGVGMERTPELVVAVLAALRAGAAFVPLDPAHPRERLAALMDDAGVSVVLTRTDLLGRLPDDARVVALEAIASELEALPSADPGIDVDPRHLAYVYYTSGSTGRPKGVMVEHGSLSAYLAWVDRALYRGEVEAMPVVTRPGFDPILRQLFPPLLRGGAVWLPGEETASDPAALMAALGGRRGTALSCVPSLWSALLDAADQGRAPLPAPHALRTLALGGERLDAALAARTRARLPHVRIVNVYGPTEITVNATFAEVGAETVVPIGTAVDGASVYVVDEALRLLPGDLPGELVVGGSGVARGYLGAPALTAERFVPDPFSAVPGARLYRTGDQARRRPDGRIDFLGRIDDQVKVRGVRVEPGEVEAALRALPAVRDAAVAALDDGRGGMRLVAYVVPADGDASPAALRGALGARLPEAMVPTAFVALDALPRTPNGKVDRRALPAPDLAAGADEWVEPATETERRVAEIWAEVIGIDRVGSNDDFFLLGGHSLLATQVVSRVREAFRVELPLRAIFEATRLSAFAARVDAAAGAEDAIPPRGGNDLPLSFAQERLWFIDRMDPGSTVYNLATPLRLAGPLDVRAMERALGEMVRRHAVLRTRFAVVDGRPVQRIESPEWFHPAFDDVSALPEEAREARLAEIAAAEARTPFDLEAGPLFRARLVRAAPDDHLLVVGMHHAVTDGWGSGVFWRELVTLYGAFLRGEPSPLPALPVRYADFAAWQREWLRGPRLGAQVAWWREHLAGAPAVLTLPTDRPRPPVQSHRGARVPFSFTPEEAGALRALALEQRGTPFMALLAAFGLVLSRWSGQDDVVVGTPVAGRTRREVEGVVGLFVNTLPIRADLSGDPSFRALLARVREATLGAYAHQDLPFERLVEELAPERSLSHAPVFQVLLMLHNAPDGPTEGFAGLEARGQGGDQGSAKADLTLVLSETPDGRFAGALEYATDLFDEATARRLAGHLRALARSAAARPDAPVSSLEMMDGEERAALVAAGSATASFPVASIPALFGAQAARAPDAVAVTFGGESVSYAELDARANRLAHRLVSAGARPDSLVGLFVDRSIDTVVGILAILKAGAGYLPLDPAYPEDRLAYMLEDSGASLVVATQDLADASPKTTPPMLILDTREERAAVAARPSTAPEIDVSPDSLAYVIYTSGSTGKPKGVQVTHANVVRLFRATDHWFGFGAGDVWTLFHSYAFDFSVWEIWGALLYGGRLVVVPFDVSRSPEDFYALLETEGVTVLNQTPSAFRQLMRADEEAAERGEMRDLALRSVVFGGEALDPATLRGWVERRGDDRPTLVNMYGITETTVHVTYRVIRAKDTVDGSSSPIGVPIPDLAVHLLDRNGRLVPAGIVGEMHVGGAGVARGYLHRPELTAQRFVPDPFSADADARLYRSGDLARRLPDGSLEFHGRADDQVKVRGFRIELGEIESVLLDHPSVREAVVLARGEGDGRRLVAWVVAEGGSAPELRAHLGGRLPDYMVPAAFVFLDALPLTRHGKVDRRALPEPDAADLGEAGYVAPRTPTEELLAAVWAELLGAARVGVDDSFFVLGGHSLLATRVASRVRETLGVELPVRAVFEHPTLAALAAEVDRLRRADEGVEAPPIRPAPRDGDLPLSFAQERMWFVDRMEAGGSAYHMPLFARLEGELDADALRRALDELARRHESLRTSFPLVDGVPVQRVSPPAPVDLLVHDYAGLREDERDDEAGRLVREHARIPFTLETGPLFRADLARLGERDHLLLLTLHHVIADGWSLDVLWRELAALYGAFSRGEPSPIPEPRVQYGDFSAWQRAWLKGEVLERQLAYWRRALAGAPPLLKLPADRPRPAVQTHHAAMEAGLLPRQAADAVLGLARREGATLFMVLLAALDVVLSRQSGQGEVVVGTPIAGRTRAETEGVVGLFLNSLALRVDLAGDPAFRELLGRVRDTTLGAYAHQDVPFEAVLEELAPERTLDRTPVFQVLLNLANFASEAAGDARELPGLVVHGVDRGAPLASKFDLTLYAGEVPDGIVLRLVYNPDLFDAGRMRALLAQVGGVLEQAAADPSRPVSALSLAVDAGAPPLAGDRAVRTPAGAPAGVGELGEVWARGADGEWRPTGARGRARPDGAVDLVDDADDVDIAASTSPSTSTSTSTADTLPSEAASGREPTETERVMLEIWREVLEMPGVGLHDDFFDLGGYSLLGVRLLAQVKKRLGAALPLPTLFGHPTPAALAGAVEDAGKPRDFHHLVALGDPAAGTLPPLFCVHAAGGTGFRYRDLAARLGPARPVYALQAQGVVDGREPLRTVDLMAERYVEEVRRARPDGPYHLLGWSAGGVIAVEMAHRLRAAGQEVAFVGLLDSSPPKEDAGIPDPLQIYLRLAMGLTGKEGPALDRLAAELSGLSIEERLDHLAAWLARNGAEGRAGELDGLRPVLEVFRANVAATRRHPLAPYPGELSLFCAESGRGSGWEAVGLPDRWRPLAPGGLRVEIVPGTHVNLIAEPHVAALAAAIEDTIAGAPPRSRAHADSGAG